MLVAGSERMIKPDLERWYATRTGSHKVEVLFGLFRLALPRSLQSCGHLRDACTLMLRDDKLVRGRQGAVLSGSR